MHTGSGVHNMCLRNWWACPLDTISSRLSFHMTSIDQDHILMNPRPNDFHPFDDDPSWMSLVLRLAQSFMTAVLPWLIHKQSRAPTLLVKDLVGIASSLLAVFAQGSQQWYDVSPSRPWIFPTPILNTSPLFFPRSRAL